MDLHAVFLASQIAGKNGSSGGSVDLSGLETRIDILENSVFVNQEAISYPCVLEKSVAKSAVNYIIYGNENGVGGFGCRGRVFGKICYSGRYRRKKYIRQFK